MDGLPELSPAELVADQGPKVVVIAAIVYALAVVAVGLRFLSRRIARCGLQADDWLILGAVTLSLSSLILSILCMTLLSTNKEKSAYVASSGAVGLRPSCSSSLHERYSNKSTNVSIILRALRRYNRHGQIQHPILLLADLPPSKF